MKSFLAIVIILILSAPAGCLFAQTLAPSHAAPPSNAPAIDPGRVVVKVNGTVFTERDVREVMQTVFPFYAVHGGKVPSAREPEIRQKAVQQLVVEELVYEEAQRRKIAVPTVEVQKALRKARAGFGSKAQYDAWVRQRHGSERNFENQIRRAAMVRRLWDIEVTKKAAVTESELRAYYRQNQARFVRPESVALQSITVSGPQIATEEQRRKARTRAEEVLGKAKAAKTYEEFGVLAETYSEDDWRVMMGDHKVVHRGSLAPELERVAFQMPKGATSGLIQSGDKYVILRVNDTLPATQVPFAEIRNRLREEMHRERLTGRTQTFEATLRKGAQIEVLDPSVTLPKPQRN